MNIDGQPRRKSFEVVPSDESYSYTLGQTVVSRRKVFTRFPHFLSISNNDEKCRKACPFIESKLRITQ